MYYRCRLVARLHKKSRVSLGQECQLFPHFISDKWPTHLNVSRRKTPIIILLNRTAKSVPDAPCNNGMPTHLNSCLVYCSSPQTNSSYGVSKSSRVKCHLDKRILFVDIGPCARLTFGAVCGWVVIDFSDNAVTVLEPSRYWLHFWTRVCRFRKQFWWTYLALNEWMQYDQTEQKSVEFWWVLIVDTFSSCHLDGRKCSIPLSVYIFYFRW